MDADEAVELCDEILRLIEEEVPESAIDRATDFFESVEEKVKSMRETIAGSDRVSERQEAALNNMRDAVNRWIH